MKKILTLFLGMFALLVIAGCAGPFVSQQQCDGFKTMGQRGVVASGAKILQRSVFYSGAKGICYEGTIAEAGGIRIYSITRIIPNESGYIPLVGPRFPPYNDNCVTDKDMIDKDVAANNIDPRLVNDDLRQSVKENLCSNVEATRLKAYQAEIQRLIGK